MAPLLVALLLLALVGWRMARGRRTGRPEPFDAWLVAGVLALPVLYAAATLWAAGDRLDGLHLRYVGKRLAWGPGIPLTAGGARPGAETAEDLHHPLLAAGALRLEAADEATAEELGVPAGSGYLRLGDGAPLVRVDGRWLNTVALAEGDRLVLEPRAGSGGEPVELVLTGGALVREGTEASHALTGRLERLVRPGRVVYLPDALAELAPEWPEGGREDFRSVLLHEDGAWHLGLRDAGLRVVRDGEALPGLEAPRPVPRELDLALEVAWGGPGQRRLRTVRTDRLRLGTEAVEVRFEEPQRRRIPLDVAEEVREIGLVVPSAVDRRAELVELDERSGRFHGLAGTLRYDPETERAALEYLGARWEAEPEALYALGEGDDLLLLRVGYGRSPARVLLDLVLFALFCGAFLGRVLAASPALTAVVGGAGVLLADRLLFSFRAATEPPDYLLRSYAEARVALWLVPALILFGGAAAVLLRAVRTGAAPAAGAGWRKRTDAAWRRAREGLRPLRWPVAGLAVAALGLFATVRGPGVASLRSLALVPLALAVGLLVLHAWAAGPGAARLERWRQAGWSWPLWALPAVGAGILGVRLVAWQIGMPEALRLPGTSFRLLWTALQLPVAALALGLTAQLLEERSWPQPADPPRVPPRLRGWRGVLAGVAAVWTFVALAFLAIGWLAGDRGLFIVHSLPAFFLLVLLVPWPAERSRGGARAGGAPDGARRVTSYAAGVALALLPLLTVAAVNRWPQAFVAAVDRVTVAAEAAPEPAADPAARLRASPEQQRFRLLMLANPELLSRVGVKPAEQAAVQYATIKGYAGDAGWTGDGFASSELPRHLGVTYLNDLMPMAFVLADFGKLGMLGLALTYLAFLLAAPPALARGGGRWGRQGGWIAAAALLSFALPGLYMVLANLNLVLFTGKNAPLLALNSTSDVLQSGALLGLAAFGLALRKEAPP